MGAWAVKRLPGGSGGAPSSATYPSTSKAMFGDGTAYSGVPLARFFEGGANDHEAVIAAMAKANTEALDAMI